jgi:hypothetical protein
MNPKQVELGTARLAVLTPPKEEIPVRDVEKAALNTLPLFTLPAGVSVVVVAAGDEGHAVAAVAELEAILSSGACDVGDAGGRTIRAIGFDTETRPCFQAGRPPNRVSLVQLYARGGSSVFLFRLQHGIPVPLLRLLGDRAVMKVGVGVRDDVAAIRTREPTFDDHGSFADLSPLLRARYPLLRRVGLRNATASILGRRLSKAQQMKNWDHELSPAMVSYGALDAVVGWALLAAATGRAAAVAVAEDGRVGREGGGDGAGGGAGRLVVGTAGAAGNGSSGGGGGNLLPIAAVVAAAAAAVAAAAPVAAAATAAAAARDGGAAGGGGGGDSGGANSGRRPKDGVKRFRGGGRGAGDGDDRRHAGGRGGGKRSKGGRGKGGGKGKGRGRGKGKGKGDSREGGGEHGGGKGRY